MNKEIKNHAESVKNRLLNQMSGDGSVAGVYPPIWENPKK